MRIAGSPGSSIDRGGAVALIQGIRLPACPDGVDHLPAGLQPGGSSTLRTPRPVTRIPSRGAICSATASSLSLPPRSGALWFIGLLRHRVYNLSVPGHSEEKEDHDARRLALLAGLFVMIAGTSISGLLLSLAGLAGSRW